MDQRLLCILATGDDRQLEEFCTDLKSLSSSRKGHKRGLASDSDFSLCLRRVSVIAQTFAWWQRDKISIQDGLVKKAQDVLEDLEIKNDDQCQAGNKNELKGCVAPVKLNASTMRDWFLRNVDHPFPSNTDKGCIAEKSDGEGVGSTGSLKLSQVSLR